MLISVEEIEKALTDLPGWEIKDGSLYRRFVFHDFVQAFGFMTEVALVAERSNHHPDWRNSYRTVEVWLSTHEAGGISKKDILLAVAMQRLSLKTDQNTSH